MEEGERLRQEVMIAKKELEHWQFIYDQLNAEHQSR